MYVEVGEIPEPRKLAELTSLLPATRTDEGFACSDSEKTAEIFRPLLADIFPQNWTLCRLVTVWQNGSIPPHKDTYEGERYLLVLQGNRDSWNLHDGVWQQLKEGKIYSMDATKEHASINWGEEPRINFVVDVEKE